MEAPPGFEPGVEVLQTSALPLGDGAIGKSGQLSEVRLRACGVTAFARGRRRARRRKHLTRQAEARVASEGWSGKRDSNPRLRPWQGRTLPLSYSRPNAQSTTRSGWLSSGAARSAVG